MSWCAETDQAQIDVNTAFRVFEQPWGEGIPVGPLPSGVAFAVRFANGAVAKVDVIEATATGAIIQTSDGTKWKMVQLDPKEVPYPLPPTPEGAPATYWIVKERVT
jgi:hypothetical protein